jgi:hypothetical protein
MVDVVDTFARLHEGGRIATNYDGIRPLVNAQGEAYSAEGEPYVDAVRQHLEGEPPIGVYPLFRKDYQRTAEWYVNWLAVDLDEGEPDFVHACNLYRLLGRFGVQAWIERSRSKGFHVWVYLRQPLPAEMGREAMLGACRLVDVPTKEVYPKQTVLEGKGFGNCLLLPYPNMGNPGRQVVVDLHDEPYGLDEFVETAWASRATAHAVRSIHALYQERHLKPIAKVEQVRVRDDDNFGYIARRIWDGDIQQDRSNALYAFACSLFRQNYSDYTVLHLTGKLDERVGKFVGRNDRDRRLEELVTNARNNTLGEI